MILDNFITLVGSLSSTNQITGQLVTSLGATKGTNVIDLGPLSIGANQVQDQRQNTLGVSISILQQPTSAGAATVAFQLVAADDAALSTNVQVIRSTGDISITVLTAGRRIPMTVMSSALVARRYLGLQIVVGTAALTNVSPQFFAAATLDQQDGVVSFLNGFKVL